MLKHKEAWRAAFQGITESWKPLKWLKNNHKNVKSYWISVGSWNLMTCVLMRKKSRNSKTQGECVPGNRIEWCVCKAKIRIQLSKARKKQGNNLSRAFRKRLILLSLWFWISGLQNCEKINFSHFKLTSL